MSLREGKVSRSDFLQFGSKVPSEKLISPYIEQFANNSVAESVSNQIDSYKIMVNILLLGIGVLAMSVNMIIIIVAISSRRFCKATFLSIRVLIASLALSEMVQVFFIHYSNSDR